MGGADYNQFVTELGVRLEKLSVELGNAMYNLCIGEEAADIDKIQKKRSEIYLDPGIFEKLSEAVHSGLEPGTKLAANSLRRSFTINQVNLHPEVYRLQDELRREILSFRPLVGGSEVSRAEAREILEKEKLDRLRREAYFSELPLAAKIRTRVLELVKLRRDLAQELGAENYPDLVLDLADSGLEETRDIFKTIREKTDSHYKNYLQYIAGGAGHTEIQPWDVQFLFRKTRLPDHLFRREDILPAVREVFGGLGFDIDELGIDILFRDIPFGGLCFSINVPRDVRILANPQNGHSYYVTLFHEFGHAIYSKLVEQEHFALKSDSSPCFTEAVAIFMSRFAEEREWLVRREWLTAKQVDDYLSRLAYSRMYRLRSLMKGAVLEYHISKDPDQEIEGLDAQLTQKLLCVSAEPSTLWAANPFYVTHPVYLQNYVLAQMIAQQIYDYLTHHYGTLLGNRVVGKFLIKDFFAPGGSVPWRDKIKFATDKPLGPEALLASLRVR